MCARAFALARHTGTTAQNHQQHPFGCTLKEGETHLHLAQAASVGFARGDARRLPHGAQVPAPGARGREGGDPEMSGVGGSCFGCWCCVRLRLVLFEVVHHTPE